LDSASPALIAFVLHFPELVLEPLTLWAVWHVDNPFAKLVLSVPEVLAMLRVFGRTRLAVPWRGRRGRRLANRDLANSRDPDLSLSVR
jgi:hypothetical protein